MSNNELIVHPQEGRGLVVEVMLVVMVVLVVGIRRGVHDVCF